MKVAILTYHSSRNYGANLQAYSTYCRLRRDGFEPVVIDWNYFKTQARDAKTNIHRRFVEEHMNLSRQCTTPREMAAELARLGVKNVVMGSDALLNVIPFLKWVGLSKRTLLRFSKPSIANIFPNAFWGDFADFMPCDITMQMMSVSSQNADFRKFFPSTKRRMGERLSKFAYIGVRDEWTRDMVAAVSGNKITPPITPDPVFAFEDNAEEIPAAEDVLAKYSLEKKSYVLMGFRDRVSPDAKWTEKFSAIVSANGLKTVALPMPAKTDTLDYIFKNPPTPLEWYVLIKNAHSYVGNNMHPIVISIHNSVPFFVFDQYGIRKLVGKTEDSTSKTYNLLARAGLLEFRTKAVPHDMTIPSPESVWQKLESFDISKSNSAAEEKRRDYFEMMKNIESNFIS